MLATRWTDINPQAAVAFAMKQASRAERSACLAAVLARWIERDSSAVIAWFDALPSGWEKTIVASPALASLNRLNPRAALQLFQSLPSGAYRDGNLAEIFTGWTETDPQSAAAAA